MNSNEFKDKLTFVTPEVPEHFHNRLEMTLENIVSQEAQMKDSTKQTMKKAGRFSSRTVAIALAITLMLGAVAFAAATQWHLFDHIPFLTGNDTPKNADSLMQSDLYHETINNVEINVQEAGYDGRTLFLQYSYRMLDVDKAFTDGITVNDELLLYNHNVGWWIDNLWINGKCMDMANGSGGLKTGSDVPGEIIVVEYWRLHNEGFSLNGPVQISLPIGERQNLADYSRKNHPEMYDVDGTLKLPDKGVVTFTYDAGDIRSQVTTFKPDGETVLPEVTAKVREAAFSPLMTYITLDLKVDPDVLAAFIAENGPGEKTENSEVIFPYSAMDVFSKWINSLELVDGQGVLVFPGNYGLDGYGNEWAEFLYPYLENIPDELYLAPIENGAADMSQAVRVK